MQLTDAQWEVMNVLWKKDCFSLKEIEDELKPITGWSKNTVYTYLVRMEAKGIIKINKNTEKPYQAALSKDECVKKENKAFLKRVYKGKTSDLISAFLKEEKISKKEIEELRHLLDEMEV